MSQPVDGIRVSDEGSVRLLTIERPAKKNALTFGMYDALVTALREADASPSVRVIALTGAGGAFTAGNDLNEFLELPLRPEDSPPIRLLLALVDLAKPLVVAVDGVAVGIGTTLLLHADYVAASDRSRFQLPFVNLGLVPEGGSSVLLPRLVGMARASELLLQGEPFDAAAAQAAGLVNAVFPGSELLEKALARARALAERPPAALAAGKKLLRDPIRAEVKDAILREARVFYERLASEEVAQAVTAFFQKQKKG